MPIEIGPDGTPFVVSTIVSEGEKDTFSEPKTELTNVPEIKKEMIGMDKRIEDSIAFNESLRSKGKPLDEKAPVQEYAGESSITIKLEAIRLTLKNNGMDSQQQGKAYADIKSILGW